MFHKLATYLKSLNPAQTPADIAGKGDLLPIQERILHIIYLGAALLSVIVLILVLPGLSFHTNSLKPLLYIGPAILFVLFSFWRSAPYILRAEVLLFIIFLFAVLQFSLYGFGANGGAVLLAYILFANILFDVKIGLRATLLGILMVGAMAFAFRTGILAPPDSGRALSLTSLRDWVEYSLPLILVIGLTASAISSLLKGLSANLAQARNLSARLQEEQKKLDSRLVEGTSRLERRELQLRSASQIARDFSTVLDPKLLLNQVVNSIRENFDLYYVGVFLVDEDGRYAVLRAGTGDAGEKMLTAGHSLEIGGASMIGWCVANRTARIALDVGAEQVHFNNPYLPMTRSEMALPVVFQDRALGALTVQSVEPSAFVNEDIMILQGIADSLAIALENAQLFQKTQQALEELRLFNQAYVQDTWGHTLASQGELAFTFQNQGGNLPEGDARLLTIPVTLREEKIGEINLETTGDALSTEDRAFLDAILTQTALALENARLIEETQRRAVQEQKLNDLSTQLSKASSIEYILQTAARELGQLPMVSEVSVQLVSTGDEPSGTVPVSNGNGKEH